MKMKTIKGGIAKTENMTLLIPRGLDAKNSMVQMKKPTIADRIIPTTAPITAKYAVGSVYRATLPANEFVGQKVTLLSLVCCVLIRLLAKRVARMHTAASVSIPPCSSTNIECTAIRSAIPNSHSTVSNQELY
jgi:hypothetical protein